MLRVIKTPWSKQWQASLTRTKANMILTPLTKRNLAYPKEGVFQSSQPPSRPQPSSGYPEGGVFSPQAFPRYPTPATSTYPPQFPSYAAQPTYPAAYPAQPPLPPPTSSSRWRFVPRWTTVVSALLFTGIGIYYTHAALDLLTPAVPGSEEDEEDLALLSEELDELILVKQLRDTSRVVDGRKQPVFQEWTAYNSLTDPSLRSVHFSTGPLAGSAGMAAQRIFWDESSGIMCCFINFGPATTGWPNVVHGGALATIADETLCRFAMRDTKERACMTANLEMKYVHTVNPGQWFVFVASLDPAHKSTDRKKYVKGLLACCSPAAPSLQGNELRDVHVHVEAKGLFVVPKHTEFDVIPDEF